MLVRLAYSKSPSGPVASPRAANWLVGTPLVLSEPLPANRFVTLAKPAVPDKRHVASDYSWVPTWLLADLPVADLPEVDLLAVG